jgi:hypothetical protein
LLGGVDFFIELYLSVLNIQHGLVPDSWNLAVTAILCNVDFEIKLDSLDNACWNAKDKEP